MERNFASISLKTFDAKKLCINCNENIIDAKNSASISLNTRRMQRSFVSILMKTLWMQKIQHQFHKIHYKMLRNFASFSLKTL